MQVQYTREAFDAKRRHCLLWVWLSRSFCNSGTLFWGTYSIGVPVSVENYHLGRSEMYSSPSCNVLEAVQKPVARRRREDMLCGCLRFLCPSGFIVINHHLSLQ